MDTCDPAKTTETKAVAEKTDSNDTKIHDIVPLTEYSIESIATKVEECDNQLVTSNVSVQPETDICVSNFSGCATATATIISKEHADPVPDTTDLESNRAEVINSSLFSNQAQNLDIVKSQASDATSDTNNTLDSLDAALDNLNEQVSSLLDANSAANVKSNAPDAPLDEALATLNNEVLGLLKESRIIQDELKKASDSKGLSSKNGSRSGLNQAVDRKGDNQYFDYSLYRERSASPPPYPLITYRWEDVRREKERGGYPWTYLNPQDFVEQEGQSKPVYKDGKSEHSAPTIVTTTSTQIEQAAPLTNIQYTTLELPSSLLPEPNPSNDLLSFNFDNIDTQRAIDSYSVKSSVKNSSSGILEVLQDLEAEEERENDPKKDLKSSTTQSHQDLSTFKPKEESKRFALRSLLKRTHSAPKKIQVSKTCAEDLDRREKSPPSQVQCCHPIVEKLKTMADKQLHKKAPKKQKPTIKTVSLPGEKKIVLAEQTRIIRLKDSPKADRKNVAAYLEKRDSDDIVEILQLDESPSETRKRREETRKFEEEAKVEIGNEKERELEEKEKENEKEKEKIKEKEKVKESEKGFVVPPNLTGTDTEPTVEELLEEEFKNDPPKKAPRKTKEHIYEEIEAPGQLTAFTAGKLGKPANLFANAVLHSVLNKDDFKESLKRQNEIEDAEEINILTEIHATKPVPEEVIDLKPIAEIEQKTSEENNTLNESKPTNQSGQISKVEIKIEIADEESCEEAPTETSDFVDNILNDARKNVLMKEEKKVTFSQSTEEYQEKIAAEKGPVKEDVELPEHIKVAKRWSNMSDHEYEPIGEPIVASAPNQSLERPVVKITEPDSPTIELPTDETHVDEKMSVSEFTGTESPIRSITPFTDISRTEEIHTSQIDDSVIEELPLRREDRKKKSFMTNAGEHTKNLQNKISSQASNLRTKFKRSLKSSSGSNQKASGSNLKSSLKSSPKISQASPKERKKFKRIDLANKLKSIHMPKMSKPELPKFKMPDKFRKPRNEVPLEYPATITTITTETEGTVDEPSSSACGIETTPTIISCTTEEIIETKTVPKKRFEFGSYPKIFNRFKSHTKPDEHDVTDFVSEDTERDTETQPSSSSFSTHFATVPRAASKIKNTIISKWNKSSFAKTTDRETGEERGDREDRGDSESIPQGSQAQHDDVHEDSVERRIRLASKISMDDEEEPLGILQTKEQIQLANYDEENRAIHEISRAREKEFKARKPLTHQDSDLISEESNRDIDWEECERMRNKIMGSHRAPPYKFEDEPKRDAHGRRNRNDSNFSTEETQSSGSSGDRRRTGVIEDIDDDEFFLRQRGVSQDNADISKYISSAIREGMSDNATGREFASYSFNNSADFADEFHHFDERPRKPLRRRTDFNRSFESYDDFRHENLSENELPVATQYFPRHDDENISFYDNDFTDDLDQPNILSRDVRYDSDIENEEFHGMNVRPEVPKRRRKSRALSKQDSIETNEEVLIYRSEPSFSVPMDKPSDTSSIIKPVRNNQAFPFKSDLVPDNEESLDVESAMIETSSPSNSRYMISINGTNGYATVKKEPVTQPHVPARHRKRSTKSVKSLGTTFTDSPFPERHKRGYNIAGPLRPPRRGSSSSLIDPNKPPSIAPSDGTQYEEIDDEIEDDENHLFPHNMQNFSLQKRPLPPPPRPPRDKRHRRKSNIDKKFDDADDFELVAGSFDDATSEFSTREFVGAEMATQTSLDIDDLYINEDIPDTDIQYTKTVEEILKNKNEESGQQGSFKTSDDNLSKGIQKFRESNQRSYSERSRASTERQSSRPITPSALLIEQRVARSPIQMDATLIMQPIDTTSISGFRTDSAESEYVPYADEVDDTQIDTEDERIINAAIRRYQMLGNDLDDVSNSSPRGTTPKPMESDDIDIGIMSTIEVPVPPPRRKSSASTTQVESILGVVPLAEPETLSVASTQDLNQLTPQLTPELVNDLSTENIQSTYAHVDTLTVVNIQSAESEPIEKSETKPIVSTIQITPEVMQEIIERVRETLPVQQSMALQVHEEIVEKPIVETETKDVVGEEPPKRPPTPTDYTPTSEIPDSFYQLRTGISEDESVPSIPPAAAPKHRPRRPHTRRPESSSDEECSRRHHHHTHHAARSQDSSVADLSGQLIRACGRALSSSLNTAGHSLVDFIRSLTKNQDEKHKDLSLVLVILIIIVATLMLLGISGDRPVHHHHWDFFFPDKMSRP